MEKILYQINKLYKKPRSNVITNEIPNPQRKN